MNDQRMAAMEAVLFSIGDLVSEAKLAEALELSLEEVRETAASLKEKYDAPSSGISLMRFEDGYQLASKPQFHEQLVKIVKKQRQYRLTDTVMETLAIIAYKQPVTKAEIEKIRGVSSDHAVNKLLEFGLVSEQGRLEAPGRPILFGTTKEFLRVFSVSETDELPVLDTVQMEEFKRQAEEELQLDTEV